MPDWTKADYDAVETQYPERYLGGVIEPPQGQPRRQYVKSHYHWWTYGRPQAERFAPMLASVLGLAQGDYLLDVGCGFNWTGRGLQALGYNCIGLETSSYIQAQKANTEEAELRDQITAVGLDPDTYTTGDGTHLLDTILEGGRAAPKVRSFGTIADENLGNAGSRNRVRGLFADEPRYIMSEEVLNSITDAECLTLLDRASAFLTDKAPNATIVHILSPYHSGRNLHPSLNWKTYGQWRAFLDAAGFASHRILPSVTSRDEGIVAYSGLM